MKLKSRGLGRKELVMDFREYTVTRDGAEIVIEGAIREPVRWDFSIRVCEDDLPGITRVALSRKTLGLLIRSAFKRKKRSHWNVDRETHLNQVREVVKARAEEEAEAEAAVKAEAEAAVKAEAEVETKAAAKAEAEAPPSANGETAAPDSAAEKSAT